MTRAGPRVVRADAIVVGDGTSIRDGAVVLDESGIVLDLGPAVDVLARSSGASIESRTGVLLPGLVNAHVHLELSGMRGRTVGGAGFVPWLESLQHARADEDELERAAAIDRAIAGLLEAGVVAIGEVTNGLGAWRRASERLLGTIFHEVFAIDRAAGLALIDGLDEQRDRHAPTGPRAHAMRWIPVPHALYSTHPDVVRAIVARVPPDAPSTMHLAEHAAERAFLARGEGPWRAFLERRGLGVAAAAFPIDGRDPIAIAESLGVLRPGAAMVHLVDARSEELDRVAAQRAIVVMCPRSNLTIETKLPALETLRARGVALAIGTDSLASAPSLDPLADARALFERNPGCPAAALVCAATSGSARAIGWGESLGRLARGTRPGVLHVAAPQGLPPNVDPSAWLLCATDAPRVLLCAASRKPS